MRTKVNTYRHFLILVAYIFLSACSSTGLYHPLPQNLENEAYMHGFQNIRAWGDKYDKTMVLSAQSSFQQVLKAHKGRLPKETNALALSGGGADGALVQVYYLAGQKQGLGLNLTLSVELVQGL